MPKQRINTLASSNSNTTSSHLNLNINASSTTNNKFINIKNIKISDIVKLIPPDASKRILTPTASIAEGIEYKWVENQETWRVRFHSSDLSAPSGSNSNSGWIARISRGKKYMDSAGFFHSPGVFNPSSPNYDEGIANDTHIPVENDLEMR